MRPIAFGVLLAVVVLGDRSAWGAPCASACKDEIAACRASECAGLAGKTRRRCKKRCAKDLVRDCYVDLAVCGATSARPSKKPAGGGGGGGVPVGGW